MPQRFSSQVKRHLFGLGKFFSSIYSRAVTGLGFQTLSLLDVSPGKSWPIIVEQILPPAKEEKESLAKEKKKKRGRGRRPIYGNKVDDNNLPSVYLQSEQTHQDIRTRIYQMRVRHKKFADRLNVVMICKEDLKTGKKARVILFTTDLALAWEKVIHYYRLRFQIEFNFRDAKQHWGLEDFMVIKEESVLNAANLSLFMVNVSQAMLARAGEQSILDLKARYHGLRYAQELFKLLPQNLQAINIHQLLERLPVLGRIHGNNIAA